MISIYICDDNAVIMEEIAKQIQQKIMMENYDMKIAGTYEKAQELLAVITCRKDKTNIYFLDVELKDETWDGFLLGKEIRKQDPNGIIVYITSYQDLAYKTFQYHIEAFDYIIKDVDKLAASIEHCLQEIQNKLCNVSSSDQSETITIRIGDSLKHIKKQDIYFFETSSKAHHVLVHTKQGRIDFVGNLNELEKQLGDSFMRVHRSYLVALPYIEEINLKENYIIVGKQKCLISKKAKSRLLQYRNRV